MNRLSNKKGAYITAAILLLPVLGWITSANAVLQPAFEEVFLEDVDGRSRAWGVAIADFT
ncbi:MAG: hypothetical protein GQ542_16475, partial [Desulforhopalus sp.]|nr:hypothetical protein [Desulforhopalus sp.]